MPVLGQHVHIFNIPPTPNTVFLNSRASAASASRQPGTSFASDAPPAYPFTCCSSSADLRRATSAPTAAERGGPAVSGAAVGRPGEGVPPPFPIIGTKETAP